MTAVDDLPKHLRDQYDPGRCDAIIPGTEPIPRERYQDNRCIGKKGHLDHHFADFRFWRDESNPVGVHMIHLPALVADEFGIDRSEARRRISLGRIKLNGKVVTDLDVDLAMLDGKEEVRVEMECHPTSDAIVGLLAAQASALAMEDDDDE